MGCPTTISRSFALAALMIALALLPSAGLAQESSPWWPGGQAPASPSGAATAAPAAGAPAVSIPAPQAATPDAAPAAKPDGGWMLTSPLANVSWPEIKMPKLQWNQPQGAEPNAQQQGPGPMARVRQATQNMAQQTRMAWNKTVDRLKFGGRDASPTADKQPGFFARLFGPEPSQGSQTVPEFLAQERPGMTGR